MGEIKHLPESQVEWEGEINAELIEEEFQKSLDRFVNDAELPGFRKGKAPRDLVLEKIGDMAILDSAAERALDRIYADMVTEKALHVIGHPSVTITKIARKSPLGFRITVSVLPTIKLPDYKKISKETMKKEDDLSVSDEEIENVLMEIRKHHFHTEQHKNGVWTDHNHGEIKDEDVPPLTDELVKQFGPFENVLDMKQKIRENVLQEKQTRAREKKRSLIIESIIESTEFDVPRLLVENELDSMMAQFEGDIGRSGLSLSDYLTHIKKSTEDIRGEWRETAIKKAKAQVILSKVAEAEKLIPESEAIRKETEKLLIAYPGADPVRARSYVAMHMQNDLVFTFFESHGEKKSAEK